MGRVVNWFRSLNSPCEACLGTGISAEEVPEFDENVSCPTCQGKGYIRKKVTMTYENYAPDTSITEEVDGLIRGKVEDGQRGRLVEEIWERDSVCPDCKGKKIVSAERILKDTNLVCQKCHGRGKRVVKRKIALIICIITLSLLMPYVVMILVGVWAFVFGLWVALRETILKGDAQDEL